MSIRNIVVGDKTVRGGKQNLPEFFHLPEYDQFSWQNSQTLLKVK